ncbi:MAG: hypothetical protein QOD07_2276 [Frankiaceae bacterium]|jgi:hypothetical protein|nr:hypothetical protein [Frankiaceae bacterium]
MYVVGTDEIVLRGSGVGPGGIAHAVDLDGDVLCRDERARYQFPWLGWMTETTPEAERSRACPECTTVALQRALPAAGADDPYPTTASTPVPAPPAPVQPAMDWLRLPQDFTVWSNGL